MYFVDSDQIYLLTIYGADNCILSQRAYTSYLKAISNIQKGIEYVYNISEYKNFVNANRITFKQSESIGNIYIEAYLDGAKYLGEFRIELIDYEA